MEAVTTTIDGVRKATGLGRTKIFELIKEGRLSTVKVGRRTLVTAESVRRLAGVE